MRTTCAYCGVGCNFDLNVADGKVVGVTAAYDAPVNQGNLCVKGRYGFQFIGHPDRLTQPLVRRDGELVPATWDEALDLVAERLPRDPSAEHGPDAVGGLGVGALHQRGELPLPEVHARRARHAQRRPLRPYLTRSTVAGLAAAFGAAR